MELMVFFDEKKVILVRNRVAGGWLVLSNEFSIILGMVRSKTGWAAIGQVFFGRFLARN